MTCEKESTLNKWLTSISLLLAIFALWKYISPESPDINVQIISTHMKKVEIAIGNTGNAQGLVYDVLVKYKSPRKDGSGWQRVRDNSKNGITIKPNEIHKFTLESSKLLPLHFNEPFDSNNDTCSLKVRYLDAELDKGEIIEPFYCSVIEL